jgi:hypothetical protein
MTDLLWNWRYKCSIIETQTECKGGGGTFTTSELQGSGGDQYYLVTGITGTVEGNEITSLLPPKSLGFENDNKLSAPSGVPFLNAASHKITGIAFLTNNDPPTKENLNLLCSNFIDNQVGYMYQLMGPNNLELLNTVYSASQVGDVAPV